ncbi:MAG: ShlB/FhaC/HecB family hemolysin secretion/activation protein [Xenococcaceae cyanobacterium MO_167.B52]|nr:ShlB/FhaC/HecB family hemolysin secretion/activation protein [Xenococcaceae cyanobacterium MO_167.B52]
MLSKVNLRQIIPAIVINAVLATSLKAQTVETNPDTPQLFPQDINPPPTPPSLPETAPSSPPSPEELLPAPTTSPEELLNIEETIIVTEFIFTGNTAFSSEELRKKFTIDLTNKNLSITRLLQIASDIATLYAEQGYSTSGAIIALPETTQQQGIGVVEIKVIEGELTEINVFPAKNSLKLNPKYIRSRINLATSKPLNIYHLQEALQLLQLNPLIDSISATLSAGASPEQSILEITVLEADTFNLQIFADNNRSPSVGSFRRGTTITKSSLFGWGEELSLGYNNTDGSDTFDVAYTIPINPRNGTFRFTYNDTNNKVVESPFDTLDIESKSRSYDFTIRQPIIQNINRDTRTFDEVAVGVTTFWRDSKSSLGNDPFPLSPGAEIDGDIKIFALRFTQEWTRQNASSVFALRSEFSLGLDAFNSTTNQQIAGVQRIPDSRFFSWRGQSQYVYLLAPETLLVLRGSAQIANDVLLGAEQFSIGGGNTVRGYRQDAILTDNGFLASAELRIPIIKGFSESGIVQIVPFVDYGKGWNNSDVPNPNPQNLASFGLGLRWQEKNFNFRLDYGIPLMDIDSRDKTLQEQGIYFSLQWDLF